MIPWEEIDRAEISGQNGEITLRRRGSEFSIRTDDTELMNSRLHGSEDALAELTCNRADKSNLQILIGGLGMGYTLAAAIKQSGSKTQITVSELIPAVVKWNRKHLGHLAGNPLDNPRVTLKTEDVAKTIEKKESAWDVILLDVDNGPEGLTQKANDQLYNKSGLKALFFALCSKGILGIWSANNDDAFTHRLKQTGFLVQTIGMRARKSKKGSKHTIWIATKP
jgi:spermidine synthase